MTERSDAPAPRFTVEQIDEYRKEWLVRDDDAPQWLKDEVALIDWLCGLGKAALSETAPKDRMGEPSRDASGNSPASNASSGDLPAVPCVAVPRERLELWAKWLAVRVSLDPEGSEDCVLSQIQQLLGGERDSRS